MSICAIACPMCWPLPPTCCHTSGFKNGAPYGEGTANFEAMREWNRATIYRKTIGYFADQLVGGDSLMGVYFPALAIFSIRRASTAQ